VSKAKSEHSIESSSSQKSQKDDYQSSSVVSKADSAAKPVQPAKTLTPIQSFSARQEHNTD